MIVFYVSHNSRTIILVQFYLPALPRRCLAAALLTHTASRHAIWCAASYVCSNIILCKICKMACQEMIITSVNNGLTYCFFDLATVDDKHYIIDGDTGLSYVSSNHNLPYPLRWPVKNLSQMFPEGRKWKLTRIFDQVPWLIVTLILLIIIVSTNIKESKGRSGLAIVCRQLFGWGLPFSRT